MKDMEVMEMWQLLTIFFSINIKQLKKNSIKDYNYKMMFVGKRKQNTYKMKKNSIPNSLSPYKK
jgi:hypothetical protein